MAKFQWKKQTVYSYGLFQRQVYIVNHPKNSIESLAVVEIQVFLLLKYCYRHYSPRFKMLHGGK